MLAVLVLAFAAGALAQTPQPCDGPDTFTARFRHFDRERGYYVQGKMYFDKLNKRVREFEEFDFNRTESYYDRLKLYTSIPGSDNKANKLRVIWGKVTRPHGRSGAV